MNTQYQQKLPRGVYAQPIVDKISPPAEKHEIAVYKTQGPNLREEINTEKISMTPRLQEQAHVGYE